MISPLIVNKFKQIIYLLFIVSICMPTIFFFFLEGLDTRWKKPAVWRCAEQYVLYFFSKGSGKKKQKEIA